MNYQIKLAFFVVFLFSIIGCKKSEIITPNTLSPLNRSENSFPVVEGDMLHFTSLSSAEIFVNTLQEDEKNEERVAEIYQAIGVNPEDEEGDILTLNPVCYWTERELGHRSARAMEEESILRQLNEGSDEVFSIIENAHWKTILNSYNSVHVGNRILKYFDNGAIAIILNNDWEVYEQIKNTPWNEIRSGRNLIFTSRESEQWEKLYRYDEEANTHTELPLFLPEITFSLLENGLYSIQNNSLIEGDVVYTWVFEDGQSVEGFTPDKILSEGETAMLTIEGGNTGNGTVLTASARACTVPDFIITVLADGSVSLSLPGYYADGSSYNLNWLLPDGTSSSANPFIMPSSMPSGSIRCQMLRKSDNSVACEKVKDYTKECIKVGKVKKESFTFNAKNVIRIDLLTQVGSSTIFEGKYFKKKNGKFTLVKASSAAINISGNKILIDPKNCGYHSISFNINKFNTNTATYSNGGSYYWGPPSSLKHTQIVEINGDSFTVSSSL